MIILAKFETNMNMYKKITRYLLQAYQYFAKVIEMFEQADI